MISGFKSGGCACCNETAECCLVAHHLDPVAKELTIGLATSKLMGRKRLAAELAKCVCVCANCHAKIHAGLIRCDPPYKSPRRVFTAEHYGNITPSKRCSADTWCMVPTPENFDLYARRARRVSERPLLHRQVKGCDRRGWGWAADRGG
jgi:hypothetical protein